MTTSPRRDRLRELLDALLEGEDGGLEAAADRAASSPFHFSRQLSSATGESPMAIRRRVLLERAAWQLAQGSSVTDAAIDAGYESVDGFSRAFHRSFGYPPSSAAPGLATCWPAPNGLHFHPPVNLWMSASDRRDDGAGAVVAMLVHHDVDDTAALIGRAEHLDAEELRRELAPGEMPMRWVGPSPSICAVLDQLLWNKEVWTAAIIGADLPERGGDDVAALRSRHDLVGPRWISTVADIAADGRWSDRFVDALCDPPESFVLSSVVAHVVEYSAHQRQLVRSMLRRLGHDVDDGDPIDWLQRNHGAVGPGSTPESDPPESDPPDEQEHR